LKERVVCKICGGFGFIGKERNDFDDDEVLLYPTGLIQKTKPIVRRGREATGL